MRTLHFGWRRLRSVSRILLFLTAITGVLSGNLAAAVIEYQLTPLGVDVFRYSYLLSGFQLHAYQELDIHFDPASYGTLSNGVAGPEFRLVLLQGNNPAGTFGDYSAMALVDNPSLAGPFALTVQVFGAELPASQPFFINQFDQDFRFVSTIEAGLTAPAAAEVPEPASGCLATAGVLLGGAFLVVRRRLGKTA